MIASVIFYRATLYASAIYDVVVCPSVTIRYCTKMTKRQAQEFYFSDAKYLENSNGVTLNGGAKYG